MNAVPPSMIPHDHARLASGGAEEDAAVMKWAAVHDAAQVVAMLAGLEPEPPSVRSDDLPALLRAAPDWRRERAERAIDDVAAVMEPGIAALLGAGDRGADPRPAARALWREFAAARSAVLALSSLAERPEPHRSA